MYEDLHAPSSYIRHIANNTRALGCVTENILHAGSWLPNVALKWSAYVWVKPVFSQYFKKKNFIYNLLYKKAEIIRTILEP